MFGDYLIWQKDSVDGKYRVPSLPWDANFNLKAVPKAPYAPHAFSHVSTILVVQTPEHQVHAKSDKTPESLCP